VISEVRVGITIRRPRPEVASVFLNVHYLPGWFSGVRDVEVVSGEPPAPGARVDMVRTRPQLRHAEPFDIAEYRPHLTLVLRGETRTLTLELEGVPVGTVAWLEIQTKRSGLRRLLRRLIDYRERRAAIGDLRRLKQFVESGDYRTWLEEPDDDD